MGTLDRLVLSDGQWERVSGHIIGDERTRGGSGRDNRMFVEAVLWIVRTGSPWGDLPDVFGSWNSMFRRWSRKGVWWRMFAAMSDDPDFEYLIAASTIIRAHQHAVGARRGLKIRPLADLAAGCAPRSISPRGAWAAPSASPWPPGRRATPRRPRR